MLEFDKNRLPGDAEKNKESLCRIEEVRTETETESEDPHTETDSELEQYEQLKGRNRRNSK